MCSSQPRIASTGWTGKFFRNAREAEHAARRIAYGEATLAA